MRLLLLLAAAAARVAARDLLQAAPAAEAALPTRVGMNSDPLFPVFYQDASGQYTGFEAAVRDGIAREAGLAADLVLLATLDDRIAALQNDTADWVVSRFTVTPERAKLVDFVRPYYYSAGAALFAPNGMPPQGITGFDASLEGKRLAALDGYYANDVLSRNFRAEVVVVADPAEGVAMVEGGQAAAYVDDSTNLRPGGSLNLVASIPPLLPEPYGVAVRKGNTELADRISRALRQLATGGQDSALAQYERQFFVANGAPPNPDLAALLANPDSPSVSLNSGRAAFG